MSSHVNAHIEWLTSVQTMQENDVWKCKQCVIIKIILT